MMKKIIQSLFSMLGLEVRKKQATAPAIHYNPQMEQGLRRTAGHKLDIRTIVDLGAAQGHWSLSARPFWPKASYVMFEPLEERKEALEKLAASEPDFYYVQKAAGKEKGEIYFGVTADLDGSGVTAQNNPNARRVEVSSVQDEIKRLGLPGPYLIKLDTHGFEVPILEGCSDIIKDTTVLIIECYGFQIAPGSLLFPEMCSYMDRLGFRLFDLVDVMNREKDGAFWQCDAFFISKTHPMFNDNQYQ